MSDIPNVPDFADLSEVKSYLQDFFAGKYAGDLVDRDLADRKPLNEKHAAVLVPITTIDAAHALKALTAASAGAIWTAFSIPSGSQTFTTNTTATTAIDYLGRGILTKLALAEVTSGSTTARANALLKVTIDGMVVYNNTSALSRQSQLLVVVGNLIDVSGTNLGFTDGHGYPFNSQCKIEYSSSSAGGDTTTVGWKIVKKA